MNLDIRPQDYGRVAVLFGGESAEREISMRSGQGVLAAMQRCRVNVVGFDPAQRPLQALQDESSHVFLLPCMAVTARTAQSREP